MSPKSIAVIILSAGLSSRMGEPKPLLPLGSKCVIEHVVDVYQRAHIDTVHIVLGHRASEVIPLVKDLSVSWVVNKHYHHEMLSSIRLGLDSLPSEIRAFFIQPVDIPLIRPYTIKTLVAEFKKQGSTVVYPTFLGEQGHPPLITMDLRDDISRWSGTGGLNEMLKTYETDAQEVPVVDQGILIDMDTPEQYHRIVQGYRNNYLPTDAECHAIMRTRFSNHEPVWAHAKLVGRVAKHIARQLRQNGFPMDINMVATAGYLHDIGKGYPKHADVGADLLIQYGFPRLAEVVREHMDLSLSDGYRISEKEVLYLADKLTAGADIVSLDQQLELKQKQFKSNTKAVEAAQARIETAKEIQRRIENVIQKKLNFANIKMEDICSSH